MVLGGPDAYFEALVLEGADGGVREAGLELHAPACSVQAWARHDVARREPFVEHPCCDLDQRASKARSTGGADRQLQAVVSQDDTRSHHAAHPLTRLERPAEEIGLAQHAVQVQVETGNVVARAEPEAGGQDAGVSLGVDDGDVRRVAGSVGRLAVEHLREDDGALGFSEPS